jgi:hypothetical protein
MKDEVEKDNYKKNLRLGFESNNTAHRQVFIGSWMKKATAGMDYNTMEQTLMGSQMTCIS